MQPISHIMSYEHTRRQTFKQVGLHANKSQISTQNHSSIFSIILGLPMYAVSIGVVSLIGDKPQVVAGVIYNPVSSR